MPTHLAWPIMYGPCIWISCGIVQGEHLQLMFDMSSLFLPFFMQRDPTFFSNVLANGLALNGAHDPNLKQTRSSKQKNGDFIRSYMMTSSNGSIFRIAGLLCGEIPAQRPVTRSFDVFFDLRLKQQLSKQWRRRWFETPSRSLWRHCTEQQSCGDLAPVPLSIFRSNSKFDESSERSSFKYTQPITTIFCTRHDSDTVVTCAKYRCDRPCIFYTRVFWIFIEFRIRSKYA